MFISFRLLVDLCCAAIAELAGDEYVTFLVGLFTLSNQIPEEFRLNCKCYQMFVLLLKTPSHPQYWSSLAVVQDCGVPFKIRHLHSTSVMFRHEKHPALVSLSSQ